MSEQGSGQQDAGNQNGGDQGNQGAPVAPEWARGLPEPHIALVTERKFETPGDAISALINVEKAATEYKTAAEQAAEKIKGFESAAPKWQDGLDEKAQNLIKQKGWGGADGKTLVGDMLKSYQHLETAFGADKAGRTLLKPKDASDKDAYDQIYTALGRPENADKYQYTPPDGVTPNADLVKLSKEIAFRMGADQGRYAEMAKAWDEFAIAQMKTVETQSTETLDQQKTLLTKEWGPIDGPAWSRQMSLVAKGMKEFGLVDDNGILPDGKPAWDSLAQTFGWAASAKLFAAIGEKMTEGGGPDDGGNKGFAMTPAEAKQAYGNRQLDKEWMAALSDRTHPGHKAASEERRRYLAVMYPEQQ